MELIDTLNPEAKLITDKTVRSDIMTTYHEKFLELKTRVSEITGKISITIDGWTSRNVLPFLAIRGHWLDARWNYQTELLDFSYVSGSHSGWKHSCIFRDCLSRLGIPISKILAVTGDNAGNNGTFFHWMEEYGISSFSNQVRCMCHIMNLAVQDILACLRVPYLDDEFTDDVDELEDEVYIFTCFL